ncbi:MAG: K+-sensing histidine kinase KdpD [Phenylobacterium sp.]|jgi:K+-sensing histidine kinase KdpD
MINLSKIAADNPQMTNNNSSDSPDATAPATPDNQQMALDFSSVLACAVHDMKNSLCMLIHSIDTLSDIEAKEQNPQKSTELAKIHYEASRLNTNLLQMLSLYRAEKDQLPVMIEEHYLEDIVDELICKNKFYSDNKNITIETNIDPELIWFFDDNLIGNLLNDVFVNALRYTKDTITISADIVSIEDTAKPSQQQDVDLLSGSSGQQLVVVIKDNGSGYPEHMLQSTDISMQELDLSSDRTGLGLFFARLIANAHQNKNNAGHIKLANDDNDGGSVFTLVLP